MSANREEIKQAIAEMLVVDLNRHTDPDGSQWLRLTVSLDGVLLTEAEVLLP